MSLQSNRPDGASQPSLHGKDVDQHGSNHETRQTDTKQCNNRSGIVDECASICARNHAERNRDDYRDQHREDREFYCRGITFENEIF